MSVLNVVKQNPLIRTAIDTARLLKAIRIYNKTGDTPLYGVHSARHLFFLTNKWSHKIYTAIQNFVDRNNVIRLEKKIGVLGDMNSPLLHQAANDIRNLGFHKFESKLSLELCRKLVEFARTVPSKPRLPDFDEKVVYDNKNLVANLYDFDPHDLLENPIIQHLITDESLIALGSELLGPSVRLQNLSMWWSNADFHNVSPNAAAQLYHVDMDTIKWVKIFFYLTDVTSENGPHCYIARSNVSAPKEVYREGRIEDEEVAKHFTSSDITEITGSAGTIIAADTIGLHKGKALEKGERLMMQITLANTYFGYGPPTKVQTEDKFPPEFIQAIKANPSFYEHGYF
jgi:hypothetical protein